MPPRHGSFLALGHLLWPSRLASPGVGPPKHLFTYPLVPVCIASGVRTLSRTCNPTEDQVARNCSRMNEDRRRYEKVYNMSHYTHLLNLPEVRVARVSG